MLLISAPSGAGKTTLCERVLESCPNMERAITCTTRAPRGDERDGVDYHFLDATSFLRRVESGHFLEHATVYGNSYGTLKSEVVEKLRRGVDVLINVDVQGGASIRRAAQEDPLLRDALVTVFLTPSSMRILEERLRNRGTDAEEVVEKRLGVARQEVSQWKHFDYLLLSGTVEEDLQHMMTIIAAEKMRPQRSQPPGL